MKNAIFSIMSVFLLFTAMFFLAGCTSPGGIGGTWTREVTTMDGVDVSVVFVARGKQFTLTQYGDEFLLGGYKQQLGSRDVDLNELVSEEDYNKKDIISDKDIGRNEISGYNQRKITYRVVSTGTFSISDDKIEFTLSDGSIKVLPFSRTENTIEIKGKRFIRQK